MPTIDKRINKDGTVSFRVRVRLKGFPPQVASFRRLTDAKEWEKRTHAAIREGRHFKTTEAKKHTLGATIERYIKSVLPRKPKSFYAQKAQLLWWKGQIGDYLLADITPALITQYRDKLLEGKTQYQTPPTAATVNRYVAALSHVFTIAANEWGWLEQNPNRKVKKFKEPRGRVRFLADEERKRLLVACQESANPNLYPVVVLAISTGMRRGEILNLKWEDIDLIRGRIYLQETKNNERRGVPLVGEALRVLKEHAKVRRLNSPFVFSSGFSLKTGKPLDIRSAWESALRKVEMEDFRFHDLRHTAASYLAMNGASLAEIAEVLGHKTLAMVKRYAHLSDSHTSKVVEAMNRKVFG